jgi:predicted DNA-binding transcriptional regulator AlpA
MQAEAQTEPRLLPLPATGFLRLKDVLRFIPVSDTTWWRWIQEGKAPRGRKLGPAITVWKAEEIRDLIKRLGEEAQ